MKTLASTILFLLLINRAQAQKLEWTNPDGLGKNPAFSQVVRAGKLLFIAGQTGVTADGKVVGPAMKQQYEQALNKSGHGAQITRHRSGSRRQVNHLRDGYGRISHAGDGGPPRETLRQPPACEHTRAGRTIGRSNL